MKAQNLTHGRMKVTINFQILCCTVKEMRHSTGTQPMCNQLEHSHSNVQSVCYAHFWMF